MSNPTTVSVIIPTYNGADFLGEAIQSVLDQTYPHFELIVVNDASPDQTNEVVGQFDDPRLKYIVHDQNQGAVAARETGLQASVGEIIAFLDQDDGFHPEKLQTHVALLQEHPEVGITYNGRFDLNTSSKTIRGIWQPPSAVTLADLILGFPFAPSDTVIRRKWALREDIWDDSFITQGEEIIFNGGEYVYYGRLYLAGCKFANVGRILNYRRLFPGRVFSNLRGRCKSELACQEIIFADSRCPTEIFALRNIAFMNTNLVFFYNAFVQDEITLGQALLREAIRLNPTILDGKPCQLVKYLTVRSIEDESRNHEAILQSMFVHLPSEITQLSEQYEWAVAQGYLLKGMSAIMWGRSEEGRKYFAQAAKLGAKIDESFVQKLTNQLLGYEIEFGLKATQEVIGNLAPHLEKVGTRKSVLRLKGCHSVNRAFRRYYAGEYAQVPKEIIRAIINDPKYIVNRGVLAILLRSISRSVALA